MYVTQRLLKGITRTIAGIISAIGNSFNFIILKPVASSNIPPHALKSPIIAGVQNGYITVASKNSSIKIINCGTAIKAVTVPSTHAKIIAVGKSSTDFASRIL